MGRLIVVVGRLIVVFEGRESVELKSDRLSPSRIRVSTQLGVYQAK